MGSDPAYAERIGMGLAALLLAVVAVISAAGLFHYPVSAGLTALLAGFGGAFAINAYYINTLYVLAVPIWLLGAFLAIFGERREGGLGTRAGSWS